MVLSSLAYSSCCHPQKRKLTSVAGASVDRIMRQPLRSKGIIRNTINEKKLEHDFSLHITVDKAEGIDNPSYHPCVARNYLAVLSIRSEEQEQPAYTYVTRKYVGLFNPSWKENFCIKLEGNLSQYRFLDVEVIRVGSSSEPGSSTGMEVVGRRRIAMPMEVDEPKDKKFELAKLVGDSLRPQGYIRLTMELKDDCGCTYHRRR